MSGYGVPGIPGRSAGTDPNSARLDEQTLEEAAHRHEMSEEANPQAMGARNDRAGALAYIVALSGAAVFVLGCFLPFLAAADQPGGDASISLYRQNTSFGGGVSLVGELMILFGGVAIVSLVALLGIARRRSRPWAPRALAFVAATWAVQWIGFLLVYQELRSSSPLDSLGVGYWCVLAGVVVVALGAALANVPGRGGDPAALADEESSG
jgi:uncharacterized membrane protein